MSLIANRAVALPYIDEQPSAHAIQAADALIQAELASEHATELHTSLPTRREPRFSELVSVEHDRISSGAPRTGGIDLARYEADDAPADGDTAAWKATLQRAYTSAEYLRSREVNLSLLERYGKNAWLIGNSQLEDLLRDLERELEGAKLELQEVEQARRTAQENTSGELRGLEEGWRNGVGRMLETQVAAEGLRQQILEKRRLDAPADGDTAAWKATLQRAYTSAEYLRSREVNLSLLERYGKNAWLIGNSQLEDLLRDLERELEGAKLELQEVEQARRTAQENTSGELRGLEEGWRNGVGRMLETQVAAEGLRQQILEKRRQGAA
nr:pre-mrna-splicing factor spf27 like [Quercus suber]